jgi:hypothetical protein
MFNLGNVNRAAFLSHLFQFKFLTLVIFEFENPYCNRVIICRLSNDA